MDNNDFIILKRDCDGVLIPSGDFINLKKKYKSKNNTIIGRLFYSICKWELS